MELIEKANNIFGWIDDKDMQGLIDLMTTIPDSNVIVELGAWLGKSTSILYNSRKESQTVVTIDTWLGQPDLRCTSHSEAIKQDLFLDFLDNMEQYAIKPVWYVPNTPGCYYLRMSTEDAPCLFENNSIFMIFIDADHKRVGRDIDKWKPKIQSGGIICGHDYNWDGVRDQLQGRVQIEKVINDIWIAHKG